MCDPHALLHLAEVSQFWHHFLAQPHLWERLNAARFGEETVPAPAQLPVSLPGWSFIPGMDSSGNDCASPEDAGADRSPAALARLADARDGLAFNTNGWVKRALLPFARWERFSYQPGTGTYIRSRALVQQLGMAPPRRPELPPQPQPQPQPQQGAEGPQEAEGQQQEAGAAEATSVPLRPPEFAGWVFYPYVDSPGHELRHPATGELHFRSSCASLDDLAAVAGDFSPAVVAFNTAGVLKSDVEPQVHWQRCADYAWAGLYVKTEVVAARKLLLPLPGGGLDPRLRFFQRGKTRLLAARDVDVTWLNNSYLSRRPDPDAAQQPGGGGGAGHDDSDTDDDDEEEGGHVPNDDYDSDGDDDDDRHHLRNDDDGEEDQDDEQQQEEEAAVEEEAEEEAEQPAGGGGGGGGGGGEGQAGGVGGAAQPPMQVVQLHNVCWLNLEGSFYGVGPGRYRASWWLRVERDCNIEGLNFKCWVLAKRPYPSSSCAGPNPAAATAAPAAPAPVAVGGGAPGSASAAGTQAATAAATAAAASASSAVPGPDPGSDLDVSEVDPEDLMDHVGKGWYEQPAVEFEVPAGAIYDVCVRLWNHDSWWKRGLMFKELVLTPIAAGAASNRNTPTAADAAADAVAPTPLPPGLEPEAAHFDAASGLRRRPNGAVTSWQDVHPDRRTNVLTFFRGTGAAGRCTRLYEPPPPPPPSTAVEAAAEQEDGAAEGAAAGPSGGAASSSSSTCPAAPGAAGVGLLRQGVRSSPNVAVTFDGRGGARMEDGVLPNWDPSPEAPFTFVWIGRFLCSPHAREQWMLSLNRTVANYDEEFCWSSHQLFTFNIEGEFSMLCNYQVGQSAFEAPSLAALLDAQAACSEHVRTVAGARDENGEGGEAQTHVYPPNNTWTMEAVVRQPGGTAASYHRCAAAPYPFNPGPTPDSFPASFNELLAAGAAGAAGAATRGAEAAGCAGGYDVLGRAGPRLLTWRLDSAPRAVGGADLNIGCDMRDLQHNLSAKYLRGHLAVLLIYNRALSPMELTQLAAAYAPRFGF
ncbi:hypothetical protein HYH02_007411 [Chlamydomonas schloesseri]|uniref:Uncharacterized protein n=1 Tax=Chlamydomonas schloesseri TaxID=2026947 RepID=A0A835WHS8_9CHLO|nr:hypothetical protein HYH02_007411 [Chlamydomonas schloesseri]|eukprot:KAG2447484.1 hypothetical protein HYH02_007411 [Chlamydomonas schloesseri]